MAHTLPSYEAATERGVWTLVAPYVHSADLWAVCLVSRQWNQIFSPYLWGDPASRFGPNNDAVYLALTRFKRLLRTARIEVRRFAHTLHIPPAKPEFYDGPQAGWLRDILDRLPCLQALIVSNLSFFDHQSLQAIHQSPGTQIYNPTNYGLRLLISSHCENTTAPSLATLLHHVPDLVYLDLSSTRGTRNPYVLGTVGSLRHLQVLKLSNCGLRDDDLDYLVFDPSSRLRSLDISDNHLTDKAVSVLFEHLPPDNTRFRWPPNTPSWGDRPPDTTWSSNVASRTRLMDDDIESFIISRLTCQFVGDPGPEEGHSVAFTNLYTAGNYFTVEGLCRMLSCPSLRLLDCGTLYPSQTSVMQQSPQSPVRRDRRNSRRLFALPSIEKLDQTIFAQAFQNLRSLRIHHSLVTEQPFSNSHVALVDQKCYELHSEDLRYELDSKELDPPGTFYELDDTSIAASAPLDSEGHPTFESPDDVGAAMSPIKSVPDRTIKMITKSDRQDSDISTLSSTTPSIYQFGDDIEIPVSPLSPKMSVRHSDANLTADHDHDHNGYHTFSTLKTALLTSASKEQTQAPPGREAYRYRYIAGEDHRWRAAAQKPKARTFEEAIEQITQRRDRTEARERRPGRLRPSMLPHLRTLVLTDVPITTRRRRIIETLELFMQECAEEEELARLKEVSRASQVQIPESEKASMLKLRRLVLEMSSIPEPAVTSRSLGKRESFTKSSTEDPDSELFMSAAESDFSFFGEDDGGLLVSEGRLDARRTLDDGMIFNDSTSTFSAEEDAPSIDVVAELAAFRRQQKAAYEAAVRFGKDIVEMALLGYWRGEVKIIREHFDTY